MEFMEQGQITIALELDVISVLRTYVVYLADSFTRKSKPRGYVVYFADSFKRKSLGLAEIESPTGWRPDGDMWAGVGWSGRRGRRRLPVAAGGRWVLGSWRAPYWWI